MKFRDRWVTGLGLIALVGLALRWFAAFHTGIDPLVHDSTVYLAMAEAVVSEHPFGSFPNGYPLLIAAIRMGVSAGSIVPVLLWVNVLASTATIVLAARIARRLGASVNVALGAAAFIAVFPHQIHYVRLVMTESWATFLATLGIWALLEGTTDERERSFDAAPWWFGGGLALVTAAQVRPSLILLGPILGLIYLWKRRKIAPAAIAAAGYLVGVGFFFGLEKVGTVRRQEAASNNLLLSLKYPSNSMMFEWFPPEQQASANKIYLQQAVHQPGQFLKFRAISLWEMWGPYSLPGYRAESEGGAVRLLILLRPVLLALALIGFWARRKSWEAWAALAPSIALTIVHVATFSNHRFVVPAEPCQIALAATAIMDIVARKRKPGTPNTSGTPNARDRRKRGIEIPR